MPRQQRQLEARPQRLTSSLGTMMVRPALLGVSSGRARAPQDSPRRTLEANFYAEEVSEFIRAELRLRVVAWATPPGITLTALVGKPPNALGSRLTAPGYNRPFGTSRTPSAEPSAPDIRTLIFPS